MADGFTDFAAPSGINWRGDVGVVEYGGGDKSLVVFFYNRAMHNPGKSKATGKPTYDNVTFVRMGPPGEKLNIVDRPARGEDTRRFPRQWDAFQKNTEQIPEGTPIDLLYPENPAIAATLRASAIHTIEACAELSGNAIDTIGMGAQNWVNAAQKYLSAANKGVKASQYRQDLEERDREINFLHKQVEELKNTVQELRNERLNNVDNALQALVAGSMGRPAHQPKRSFDPEMAMINARGKDERPAPRRTRPRAGG